MKIQNMREKYIWIVYDKITKSELYGIKKCKDNYFEIDELWSYTISRSSANSLSKAIKKAKLMKEIYEEARIYFNENEWR